MLIAIPSEFTCLATLETLCSDLMWALRDYAVNLVKILNNFLEEDISTIYERYGSEVIKEKKEELSERIKLVQKVINAIPDNIEAPKACQPREAQVVPIPSVKPEKEESTKAGVDQAKSLLPMEPKKKESGVCEVAGEKSLVDATPVLITEPIKNEIIEVDPAQNLVPLPEQVDAKVEPLPSEVEISNLIPSDTSDPLNLHPTASEQPSLVSINEAKDTDRKPLKISEQRLAAESEPTSIIDLNIPAHKDIGQKNTPIAISSTDPLEPPESEQIKDKFFSHPESQTPTQMGVQSVVLPSPEEQKTLLTQHSGSIDKSQLDPLPPPKGKEGGIGPTSEDRNTSSQTLGDGSGMSGNIKKIIAISLVIIVISLSIAGVIFLKNSRRQV